MYCINSRKVLGRWHPVVPGCWNMEDTEYEALGHTRRRQRAPLPRRSPLSLPGRITYNSIYCTVHYDSINSTGPCALLVPYVKKGPPRTVVSHRRCQLLPRREEASGERLWRGHPHTDAREHLSPSAQRVDLRRLRRRSRSPITHAGGRRVGTIKHTAPCVHDTQAHWPVEWWQRGKLHEGRLLRRHPPPMRPILRRGRAQTGLRSHLVPSRTQLSIEQQGPDGFDQLGYFLPPTSGDLPVLVACGLTRRSQKAGMAKGRQKAGMAKGRQKAGKRQLKGRSKAGGGRLAPCRNHTGGSTAQARATCLQLAECAATRARLVERV